MYLNTWKKLFEFIGTQSITLPLQVVHIANFIGHLFSLGLKPSTIDSHISAISYPHKILDLSDPTSAFIIRKILKGCEKLSPSSDSRLPITKSILLKLVQSLTSVVKPHYNQTLLKAIFLVAFHGLFRLGELVIRPGQVHNQVVQRDDVTFCYEGNHLTGVEIILRHYKTNIHNKPITIFLVANKDSKPSGCMCPVRALQAYIQSFGTATMATGPLFQFLNGRPVSSSFVAEQLKKLIGFIGLDPSLYTNHSFRIGAATNLASLGHSEHYIKKMGRWNSNAMQRYIRMDSLSLN